MSGRDRRVVAVQRDRVERRGQPLGRHAVGQQVEAPVGAERVAFAGEHPRRILVLALEREHAGGEREAAGHVLPQLPAQDLAVVLELRQRDLRNVRAGERRRRQRGADLLVADLHDVFVAGVRGLRLRPHVEQLLRARVELRVAIGDERVEVLARPCLHSAASIALRRAAAGARARCASRLPSTRDSRAPSRRSRRDSATRAGGTITFCAVDCRVVDRRQRARLQLQSLLGQLRDERLVERGDAVVVEARRHRAEHRHRVGRLLEQLAVALELLAHVAQRVLRALAVELVDRDEIGEVEHVDLLELGRGAELGRHHVQRHVDQRHDRRVALADARRLDDRRGRSPRPCTRRSRRAAPCETSLPASRVASERM